MQGCLKFQKSMSVSQHINRLKIKMMPNDVEKWCEKNPSSVHYKNSQQGEKREENSHPFQNFFLYGKNLSLISGFFMLFCL
jgi:hypothetical protein